MPRPESFLTRSLHAHPRGQAITCILSAAIQAVEPGRAVRRHLHRDGGALIVAGQEYNLQEFDHVYLLGLGKASLAMASAVADTLAGRLDGGLVITKLLTPPLPQGLEVMEAGHPLPDERSLLAGQKAIQLLKGCKERDLVICLISGGGSALVAAPLDGITLPDIQTLTSALLACGARIDEINTLRRHLDYLKGGGMACMATPARLISLILSDVVGDALESIASGPTAPDPTARQAAIQILEKYHLRDNVPPPIRHALSTHPETPKPVDGVFNRVQNVLIGSNSQAAQAAVQQADQEGFDSHLWRTDLQGEARRVAVELCGLLKQAERDDRQLHRPLCIVAGGETTVTIGGSGLGGRNQELALASVPHLHGMSDAMLISLATDGEDGPTDAAGAVVTGESLTQANRLGLQPLEFLEQNDSYHFFEPLGDLLKPGPTGTNVNDLIFLFLF